MIGPLGWAAAPSVRAETGFNERTHRELSSRLRVRACANPARRATSAWLHALLVLGPALICLAAPQATGQTRRQNIDRSSGQRPISLAPSAILESTGPGSPDVVADFHVLRLVGTDAVTGQEVWIGCGASVDDAIELGLRVKFEGCATTGRYRTFYFGDGASSPDPDACFAYHQYAAAGIYTAYLYIFDDQWNLITTLTKTLYIGLGMRVSGMTPANQPMLAPRSWLAVGNTLWTIANTDGRIGAATISNPQSPPAVQPLPSETIYTQSMCERNGLLYVANGSSGVPIYMANPGNFQLVGRLPSSALGGNWASHVFNVGAYLYVLSSQSNTIYVFGLANPQLPNLAATITIGDSVGSVSFSDGDFLAIHSSVAARMTIVDVRNPSAPIVLPPVALPAISPGAATGGELCAAGYSTSVDLFDVTRNQESGGLETQFRGRIPGSGSDRLVSTSDRLYVVYGQDVYKYDISHRDAPYLMQFIHLAAALYAPAWFDPDGPGGPTPPKLVLGTGNGYWLLEP